MKPTFALLSLLLFSCGAQEMVIIVHRNVPEHPSFVVVPSNSFEKDAKFARDIEREIIRLGYKVLSSGQADLEVQSFLDQSIGEIRIVNTVSNEILTTFRLVFPLGDIQRAQLKDIIINTLSKKLD